VTEKEALKKQIPEKVKVLSVGNINYYKCPEGEEVKN
jgi:hypothetical protein